MDIEVDIKKYKQYYSLAKNHKLSRDEILKLVSQQYHKIKPIVDKLKKDNYVTESDYKEVEESSITFLKKYFNSHNSLINLIPKPVIPLNDINDDEDDDNDVAKAFKKLAMGFVEYQTYFRKVKEESIKIKLEFFRVLYFSLQSYGLHPNIQKRVNSFVCFYINTKSGDQYIKWNTPVDQFEKIHLKSLLSEKGEMLLNGKKINVVDIQYIYIIKHKLNDEEINLYSEKNNFLFDNSSNSKIKFINTFKNLADEMLYENIDIASSEYYLEAAIGIKEVLILGRKVQNRNKKFKDYRAKLMGNNKIWKLAPQYIKEYHTFEEFYNVCKDRIGLVSDISESFRPLISYLENSDTLDIQKHPVNKLFSKIDVQFVKEYWDKSISNIDLDPEEAISRSKALLESLFKQILDSKSIDYDTYRDDFPTLYKKVSSELNLSPGGNHEKIFNQVLNGIKSVVEGVNAIRGKFGSSHGKNLEQMKSLPLKRHSELVVNLSGSLAIFLISTWKEI